MRFGLFGPDEIAHLPIVGEALAEARRSSLDVPPQRLRHETIRRIIHALVSDLVTETRARLAALDPDSADRIRRAKKPVVGFSPRMAEANHAIKEFLRARMYRHWRVNRMTAKARRLTEELFGLLHADPGDAAGRLAGAGGRGAAGAGGRRGVRLRGGYDGSVRAGGVQAADGRLDAGVAGRSLALQRLNRS